METPLYVTNALIDVFTNGGVNVFDQQGVAALVGSKRAAEWLEKVTYEQYIDAVIDAGAAESEDFMPPESDEDEGDENGGNYSY